MSHAEEIWVPIPGFPLYEISNHGRVVSLKYKARNIRGFIYMEPTSDGYFRVTIRRNGKPHRFFIQRLVAMVFLGPLPQGKQCNHKNGNKADNRPENIEYVTPKENIAHADQNGLRHPPKGEKHHWVKLTELKIKYIQNMLLEGYTHKYIASVFDVSPETVKRVRHGRTWRHISKQPLQVGTKIKLNDDKVRQIRNLACEGVSRKEISSMFGVNYSTIHRIIERKRWAHVE